MMLQTLALMATLHADVTPEKTYEQPTPNLGESAGGALVDESLHHSAEQQDAAADAVQTIPRAAHEADGIMHEGASRSAMHADAAVQHARDSVTTLPRSMDSIGNQTVATHRRAVDARLHALEESRLAWRAAHTHTASEAIDADARAVIIQRNTESAYAQSWKETGDALAERRAAAFSRDDDITRWTRAQVDAGWTGMTTGTVENWYAAMATTGAVAASFSDDTWAAIQAIPANSRAVWTGTEHVARAGWAATLRDGQRAFTLGSGNASALTTWLAQNQMVPFVQSQRAITQWAGWNTQMGWNRGAQAGLQSASQAWENDDQVMAPLWVASGAGRLALHLGVLLPTILPLLACTGWGAALALPALGYPAVALLYSSGLAGAAGAYALGTAVTGLVTVGGMTLGVLSAGAGLLRVAATATIGIVATTATAAGLAALVGLAAMVSMAQWLGAPAIGLMGLAASYAAWGAERTALIALHGVRVVAVTTELAARLAVLPLRVAGTALFQGTRATGVTVGEHLFGVPASDVAGVAQLMITAAVALGEHPFGAVVRGGTALDALGRALVSSGITLAAGTGAAAGTALAHHASAVFWGGVSLLGAGVKTGEFVLAAVDVPQHRAWADFRREEVDHALDRAETEHHAALGDVAVVRVNWWGADAGRVRFFVTRDPGTGERWYFQRVVDEETCEVLYRRTNQDPVARATTGVTWSGVHHTGIYNKACEERRGG
ncbi:MAG: hypothetical protein AB2A00_37170 [Myxococcota bacterium]